MNMSYTNVKLLQTKIVVTMKYHRTCVPYVLYTYHVQVQFTVYQSLVSTE